MGEWTSSHELLSLVSRWGAGYEAGQVVGLKAGGGTATSLVDGGVVRSAIARTWSSLKLKEGKCATYGPADVAVRGEAHFRGGRLGREQEAYDGQGDGVDDGQHCGWICLG